MEESSPIQSFKLQEKGLERIFGQLEAKIMNFLWSKQPATIRDVHNCLNQNKPISYNAVMTVMNRLVEKGLLHRKMEGNRAYYTPVFSKTELLTKTSEKVYKGILNDFGKAAIMQFVDVIDEVDPELLDELVNLIKDRKDSHSDR